MLRNKSNLLITEEEINFICQICSDDQTGNHLLCTRSEKYKNFCKIFYDAMKSEHKTDKQKQMIEYYKQCNDYFYWKTLPYSKKLFIEID